MSVQEAYLHQLQAILPPGQAWTRDRDANLTKVLSVIASQMAEIDESAMQLLIESDPRRALDLLADWETEFGLPDDCTLTGTTLQERRFALLQKIITLGSQSKPYFIAVAQGLGYQIQITEYRPFIAGLSRCGDPLNGAPSVRHNWRVKVLQPRVTYFRTGESEAGDLLVKITRAEDLECLFTRLKPAHTHLIFAYEGV